MASIYELAWQEARARLRAQDDQVTDLRARTGNVLQAVAIASTFLGAPALARLGLQALTLAGLVLFVVSIATCMYAMAPKRWFSFSIAPQVMIDALYDARDEERMYTSLSSWCHQLAEGNELQIERLARIFTLAATLAVADVVLWTLALGTTL